MRILRALVGLIIMPFRVKTFYPQTIFSGKRVAIIGPADSAYQEERGDVIDGYDIVIRINKSLVTWNDENEKYIGSKCDILFHNFHENMERGGAGPVDWKLFEKFGVLYLIQPRYDSDGWRSMFNYFKKYLDYHHKIFILPKKIYREITDQFNEYHPTKGFCALYTALNTRCKEVFISGFTFFKTPYAQGYRDNIRDIEANRKHIQMQGLHDIEMEFQNFCKNLSTTKCDRILTDEKLYNILKQEKPKLVSKVEKIMS